MPPKQYENSPGLIIEGTKRYHAIIKTDKGDMTVELLSEVAPSDRQQLSFSWRGTGSTKITSSTGSSTAS